jgi:hypothetical protein
VPLTKEVGRTFVHTMKYPSTDFPLMERGFSQEIDYPFRKGSSIVVRVPFSTTAVVVGWWGQPQDEDDALHSAIGSRFIDIGEIDVSQEVPAAGSGSS